MAYSAFGAMAVLVSEGDFLTLREYLETRYIGVNVRDENGQTLLMLAAQYGRVEIAMELINQGCDVNAEDYDEWSALVNAAKEGHVQIVSDLLTHGAKIEHRDMGGWTALMWACYRGHADVVRFLLQQGAYVNVHDMYHISCLVWAAGRGLLEIVKNLLCHGAMVNSGDKYGTTPLVWAARKGHTEIVEALLHAGANVDTAGMYSWTPLIVAARGNFPDIVNLLLQYKPNVNAMDKDGCTPLTIACKEGYVDIAMELLNVGAYINLQDKNGDTNLILASRAGHYTIVDALLKKYVDVDIQGEDGKTAIYWAVEKGHVDIVKILLTANPNLEIATKDGDTPLLKATRNRHSEIVQLLMDKKAKVSAADKKGDTALHIAMRARSKGVVEILLRNPKNSQLLYRPNRAGETPYNIDTCHQKSILAQIFGARRLNTNEDSENMLGYDLYSSALADILSEPSLSMPISVGLYAKWGSGKSFLLNKLEEEMKNFAVCWLEPTFEFSWLVFLIIFLSSLTAGMVLVVATGLWVTFLCVTFALFACQYAALGVIAYGTQRYDWLWAYRLGVSLARQVVAFKTFLQVVFCNPPASRKDFTTLPVKFLFTDRTKVSSSVGDMSIVQVVVSLCNAMEEEYGFFSTRVYRVFKPKPVGAPSWRWRRLCCIPTCIVFIGVYCCVAATIVLLLLYRFHEYYSRSDFIKPALITMVVIIGILFVSSLYTWIKMVVTLIVSHRHRIDYNLRHFHSSSKSHLEALKNEVEILASMIKCLDAYVGQQTRFVVVVDGLDSCEQEKVLHVLDAVHLLFSDPNAPFVTVLAIDPHVITTAIEANIHRVFHNSTISGHDYLRNIVHLPFYLQNSGLRRVKAAQQASAQAHKRVAGGYWNEEKECDRALSAVPSIRKSSISSSIPDVFRKGRKGNPKLKASESIASSIGNLHRSVTGAQDLTRVLLTDDYFSDVNPRSMRRLMNIVYVSGRLLKAFNIDFNWYHLASWINITEQWPFRTSQMILHYETHESELDDSIPLKAVFERVKHIASNPREVDTIGELDHDERKLEVFLSLHSGTLLLNDMKVFLPFTINLDPYIRKSIQEETFRSKPMTGEIQRDTSKWIQQANGPVYNRDISAPIPYNTIAERKVQDHGAIEYLHMDFLKKSKNLTSLASQKLSTMTVEGMQHLLTTLEGLEANRLREYSEVLLVNNINGRVLLTCDLVELKSVLKMTFGDWEQFRILILALREQEFRPSTFSEYPPRYNKFPSQSDLSHHHDHLGEDKKPKDEWPVAVEERSGHHVRSALEKQVTMEDSLIVGALETLNEEALEDAFEERCLKPESTHGGLTPSLLSPILSDPEEQCADGEGNNDQNELDVLYLQGPDSAPLMRRQSVEEHCWINDNFESLIDSNDNVQRIGQTYISIPEIKLPSCLDSGKAIEPIESGSLVTSSLENSLPGENNYTGKSGQSSESHSSLGSPVKSANTLGDLESPNKADAFVDEEHTPLVSPTHLKSHIGSRKALKNIISKTTEEVRRPHLERQIYIDDNSIPITEALVSPPSLKGNRKHPFMHARFDNMHIGSDSELPLSSLKSSSETIL